MNKRLRVTILVLVAVSGIALFARVQPVKATNAVCTDYSCGPSCDSVSAGTACCDDPKIDLTCQRNRLVDPKTSCTLLYCASAGDTSTPTCGTEKDLVNVNFFGINFHFTSDKEIQSLIYVVFTVFLGFVAIAVTLIGVYGAFLRSKAESPDDASKAAKLLTNAVIGLILIVLAVVIAQLVANALGVPSLDQIISDQTFTEC